MVILLLLVLFTFYRSFYLFHYHRTFAANVFILLYMKVFRSLEEYEAGENPVVTIGTFDGVHLGHRKILSRLTASAEALHGESVVISFHPHPRLVLYPENNDLRLLHSIEERIAMLDAIGIDKLLLIPFTRDFSRISSAEFIEKILVDVVQIKKIIIGYDHHFGRNRTGGLDELMEGASRFNYAVEEIPAQQIDDASISSTKIRKALEEGDVSKANTFLGYNYQLRGEVIRGDRIGSKLGFPTANIKPHDPVKLIPADGVYVVRLKVKDNWHFGMMNVGWRPTVGGKQHTIEVHILDFQDDIYGCEIRIEFLERIRDEKKFSGVEALKAQLKQDEVKAREIIATA